MSAKQVQRELVIRRGKEFWEWKYREQPDSKFQTTKIPAHPICQKPAHCKWCGTMKAGDISMQFPIQLPVPGLGAPTHVILPVQASHLVAMEYCFAHPNQPIRVGWLLTEEEIVAGRTGQVWPEEV